MNPSLRNFDAVIVLLSTRWVLEEVLAYYFSARGEGKLAEEDQVAGVLGNQWRKVVECQGHKVVVIVLEHHGEEVGKRRGVVIQALWLSAS